MTTSNLRRLALLAVPVAGLAGCLSDVPTGEAGEDHLTEEELAGDGQPEMSDDNLVIESGIGVAGKLNLWDDRNYTDTHVSRYSYDSSFNNDGFNDKASSVSNRTPYYWLLYWDSGYGDFRACIRPYSRVANLKDSDFQVSGYWFDMNDVISSVKRMTTSSSSCDSADIVIGYR
jgi:hypothetical protein